VVQVNQQELQSLRAQALHKIQELLINEPAVMEYISVVALQEAYNGSAEAFDMDQEYATGEYEPLAYKLYYATATNEVNNLLHEVLVNGFRPKGADDGGE
jgi:hypothetical protein